MQIILTNKSFVTIDDDDVDKILIYKWRRQKGLRTDYAAKTIYLGDKKWKTILMHRFILGITDPNIIIDHIDGNGLNNQKTNLRICTRGENSSNRASKQNGSSKYLGVCAIKRERIWQAHIRKNHQIYYLGRFINEKDAAIAYNNAALKLHGEFARLNVI